MLTTTMIWPIFPSPILASKHSKKTASLKLSLSLQEQSEPLSFRQRKTSDSLFIITKLSELPLHIADPFPDNFWAVLYCGGLAQLGLLISIYPRRKYRYIAESNSLANWQTYQVDLIYFAPKINNMKDTEPAILCHNEYYHCTKSHYPPGNHHASHF